MDVYKQDRALLAGKLWYAASFGCWAFILPFLNLYFRGSGYSASQIGFVALLRPFVSAPSGQAWSALADHHRCHRCAAIPRPRLVHTPHPSLAHLSLLRRTLMASVHVASVLVIGTLALRTQPFAYLLAVVLLGEVFKSPISILADAVVSAATTNSSQYGRCVA